MISYYKISHIVFDAIQIGYINNVTFERAENKVQFIPNETAKEIEDFLLVVTPEMNVSDVLVEIDKIGCAINRWRKWNEANEPVSVMGDPTIGTN